MFDLARTLDCAGRALVLDRARLAGIVNVTPDSFSDGGKFSDPQRAIAHGLQLVEDGADLLDVGGESTRPGAEEVAVEDEIARVVPVVEALARQTSVPIAIDTPRPACACRCVSCTCRASRVRCRKRRSISRSSRK